MHKHQRQTSKNCKQSPKSILYEEMQRCVGRCPQTSCFTVQINKSPRWELDETRSKSWDKCSSAHDSAWVRRLKTNIWKTINKTEMSWWRLMVTSFYILTISPQNIPAGSLLTGSVASATFLWSAARYGSCEFDTGEHSLGNLHIQWVQSLGFSALAFAS